jgi:hypothetical protein
MLDDPGASGALRSLLRREPFRGTRGARARGPLGGSVHTLGKPRVENAERENESSLTVSCRSHLKFGILRFYHTVRVLVWPYPNTSPWNVFDFGSK